MNINEGVYNPYALEKWYSIKNVWTGSCAGFAVSSLLAFGKKDDLLSLYSEIGSFDNLSELAINDERRKLINRFFIRQYGVEHSLALDEGSNKTPWETLLEIKQMLLIENRNDRHLYLFDEDYIVDADSNSYAHAVVPYKVNQNSATPNLYGIFVYDSNYPLEDEAIIGVDSITNTWYYYKDGTQGDYDGLYLLDPVPDYFNTPTLYLSDSYFNQPVKLSSNTDFIEVYNTQGSNILLHDPSGKQIGFDNGKIINELNEGVPIIPLVGTSPPPIGYFIPDNNYMIEMKNFPGSNSRISIMGKESVYTVFRDDADQQQTDKYNFNDGLSISNTDAANKNFSFRTLFVGDTAQKVANFRNVMFNQNDSLKISHLDNDEIKLINYSGSEKNYDLKLWNASATGEGKFDHLKIDLPANSSHIIAPDWYSIKTKPVIIIIDNGNDGSIDDSIEVKNEITGTDESTITNSLPEYFSLEQNYPNPFNPTTNIEFRIADHGFVTLKIFDVLGNEVATLVNEEKPSGTYNVDFDGTGLTSGVYFYKLRAGSFVQTKKMILLR